MEKIVNSKFSPLKSILTTKTFAHKKRSFWCISIFMV